KKEYNSGQEQDEGLKGLGFGQRNKEPQVVSEPKEKLWIRRTHSDPQLYLPYKMSGEEPAPQMVPVESPQMVSSVKLPILKKEEYTFWSMRMEQYLINTDYGLWQVIMNSDEPVQTTRDKNGVEIEDAKSLWDAIKSSFGGNVESKKMQKTILKQQFENFFVSDTEGLDKAYDRFQKLISLLEVHGATVSNEDANQKFLRALPSSWNNIALIMRNREGIDELDIDDLYNNLKVFEADIKALPNYFPALLGNISPDPPDNLSKYLFASLAISPFYDMQAYNAVANKPPIPPQDPITPPTILTPSLVLPPSLLFDL
nr:hypothetical protein [Tanacetum cinerariifolium]